MKIEQVGDVVEVTLQRVCLLDMECDEVRFRLTFVLSVAVGGRFTNTFERGEKFRVSPLAFKGKLETNQLIETVRSKVIRVWDRDTRSKQPSKSPVGLYEGTLAWDRSRLTFRQKETDAVWYLRGI